MISKGGLMADKAQQLFEEALALPPEARAALAYDLLGTVGSEVEQEVDEAWRVELKSRVAELERGEGRSIPWSEARRMLWGEQKK
jgi:putative addiction module component (TIGR02574 family)